MSHPFKKNHPRIQKCKPLFRVCLRLTCLSLSHPLSLSPPPHTHTHTHSLSLSSLLLFSRPLPLSLSTSLTHPLSSLFSLIVVSLSGINIPEPSYVTINYGYNVFHSREPFQCGVPDSPNGGVLPELHIAYETWGELSPEKDNVVLLHTGLSASSHAHSHEVRACLCLFVCTSVRTCPLSHTRMHTHTHNLLLSTSLNLSQPLSTSLNIP